MVDLVRSCPVCAGNVVPHRGNRIVAPHRRCQGCGRWFDLVRSVAPLVAATGSVSLRPTVARCFEGDWSNGNRKPSLTELDVSGYIER